MIRIGLFFLLILTQITAIAQNRDEKIDKAAFYSAFASNDEASIDEQLNKMLAQDRKLTRAYAGALLMKKADLVKRPKEKLNTFKEGKELLDNAISEDPANAELRFLRLVIQEQAPPILNYNDKKEEDASQVLSTYSKFPEVVKTFIRNYAQNSKTLKAGDFD